MQRDDRPVNGVTNLYESAIYKVVIEDSLRLEMQDVKTPVTGILRSSSHTTWPGLVRWRLIRFFLRSDGAAVMPGFL